LARLSAIKRVLNFHYGKMFSFECRIDESMEGIIELTWSEFSVPDKASLEKLINGESVLINYTEPVP
jgi:hypothetical protein